MRTVVNQLRKDGKIELIGGVYYIAELTSKVSSAPTLSTTPAWSSKWRSSATWSTSPRRYTRMRMKIRPMCLNCSTKPSSRFFAISDSNLRKNYDNMKNLMYRAIQELQKLKNIKTDSPVYQPVSLRSTEWHQAGRTPTWLSLQRRPGMGKTAFVVSAMRNAAAGRLQTSQQYSRLKWLPFSLWIVWFPRKQNWKVKKIRKGQLCRLRVARKLFTKPIAFPRAPIFIDDTPALSILNCGRSAADWNQNTTLS